MARTKAEEERFFFVFDLQCENHVTSFHSWPFCKTL